MPAAQRHVRAALAPLTEDSLRYPSQTGLLITATNVAAAAGRGAAAAAHYRRVLGINRRFGQRRSLTTALAWNGLGLLATAQRRFGPADSLLTAAIGLHENLLGQQHPATATVYLNYATLLAQQAQGAAAADWLDKAHRAAAASLPPDHDLFGDIAAARGAAAPQRAAAQPFYRQALDIYSRKFGPTHWKVRQMQGKLAR